MAQRGLLLPKLEKPLRKKRSHCLLSVLQLYSLALNFSVRGAAIRWPYMPPLAGPHGRLWQEWEGSALAAAVGVGLFAMGGRSTHSQSLA